MGLLNSFNLVLYTLLYVLYLLREIIENQFDSIELRLLLQ
jgi:hypothetical protein